MLSETKLKGATGFLTAGAIYTYLPYISLYIGSTAPVLTACASLLYGIRRFS